MSAHFQARYFSCEKSSNVTVLHGSLSHTTSITFCEWSNNTAKWGIMICSALSDVGFKAYAVKKMHSASCIVSSPS